MSRINRYLKLTGLGLGETGSVNFLFDQVGLIESPLDVASPEAVFEASVLAGAENVESSDEWHEITCAPDDFSNVRDALTESYGDPENARLAWKPKDPQELELEAAQKILKLVDTLEDLDDVQSVTANFDMGEEIIAAIF